ncbi:DUF4134 domain-containing protein [Paraflavitalea sp. CAU 1676]|uniref:DUF4134 domain-containing protein n=1 Tax=Paraflavitalea sp. CAU 1676 TaxID=3032598 RepID=UPI0023DBE598|nr:DUF4134 domain-containing protein [Paraflavitalea sp. CAU 1676]MDF2190513.1 DUF4134 domain-containing protein [Paraflavitalea sp. CAU 1676]
MWCLKLRKYSKLSKASIVSFGLLLFSVSSKAQAGDGVGGIQKATELVQSYFDVGTTLLYVIGAVSGLVGAVKVYQKWSSGEQDAQKSASAWFGACIFLVVVATVLESFFGV